MKRSRFDEEQIIRIPREQENGLGTADVCRKHASSARRSTSGRPSMAGCRLSDAGLRTLEDENAKLKKLLAEAMLDNASQGCRAKRW